MTDIDKFSEKTENLIEKIKNLGYKFQDEQLEKDANDAKEEAVAALESYLEAVTQDFEGREENEEEGSI